MFCRIQGRYSSTLVYTPGKSGLAQSTPKLVTPITAQVLLRAEESRAPPLSPLQVSLVPSPAHTLSGPMVTLLMAE